LNLLLPAVLLLELLLLELLLLPRLGGRHPAAQGCLCVCCC
jgi:hypothetical protein